jgi:hypothetical protein
MCVGISRVVLLRFFLSGIVGCAETRVFLWCGVSIRRRDALCHLLLLRRSLLQYDHISKVAEKSERQVKKYHRNVIFYQSRSIISVQYLWNGNRFAFASILV